MDLTEFLKSPLASTVFTGLLGVYFYRSFETIKVKLAKQSNFDSIKFKSFHEMQLEYLKELYSLMIISRNSILDFTKIGQGPEWKTLNSLNEIDAYKNLQIARTFFEKGQILIDENLSSEINSYLILNNKAFHDMWAAKGLANHQEQELYIMAHDLWKKVRTNYEPDSNQILLTIRNKFREIIVSKDVENTKNGLLKQLSNIYNLVNK